MVGGFESGDSVLTKAMAGLDGGVVLTEAIGEPKPDRGVLTEAIGEPKPGGGVLTEAIGELAVDWLAPDYGARKLTKVSEFEYERSEIFVCRIS